MNTKRVLCCSNINKIKMCDVIYWPFHNYSVHKTIVGTCHAAAKKDCPYFCQMFRYVLCKTTDKWLLTFTSFCLHLLPAFIYCLLVKLGQIVYFVMWFVKELNLYRVYPRSSQNNKKRSDSNHKMPGNEMNQN